MTDKKVPCCRNPKAPLRNPDEGRGEVEGPDEGQVRISFGNSYQYNIFDIYAAA
jgi:hypothetical protein